MDDEPIHSEVAEDEDVLPAKNVMRVIAVVILFGIALSFVAYIVLRAREMHLRPDVANPRLFPDQHLPAPHRVATIRQQPFNVARPEPLEIETQRKSLESWGWVDRRRGIVRMPIERAIDLLAAQPDLAGGGGGKR